MKEPDFLPLFRLKSLQKRKESHKYFKITKKAKKKNEEVKYICKDIFILRLTER